MLAAFKTLWQLARPRTLVVIWLHAAIGYGLVSGDAPSIVSCTVALLAILFSYMSAVATNDLADEEVDKLNLIHQGETGDRPIINHTATRTRVWAVMLAAALLSVILSGLLHVWLGIFALVMVVLNTVYSLPPMQISKRGGLAQALLPLMYVTFPMSVGLAVAGRPVTSSFIWLMIAFYSLFAGRLFLKDIRDEMGDRKVGKRTYLVRYGLRPTLIHAGIWSVLGIVAAAVTLTAQLGAFMTSIVGLLAVIGIIWALMFCYRAKALDDKLLYIAMMGRFSSMWTFFVVVGLALSYSALTSIQQTALLCLTVTIFLSGVFMLHEELQTTRRRRGLRPQRQG